MTVSVLDIPIEIIIYVIIPYLDCKSCVNFLLSYKYLQFILSDNVMKRYSIDKLIINRALHYIPKWFSSVKIQVKTKELENVLVYTRGGSGRRIESKNILKMITINEYDTTEHLKNNTIQELKTYIKYLKIGFYHCFRPRIKNNICTGFYYETSDTLHEGPRFDTNYYLTPGDHTQYPFLSRLVPKGQLPTHQHHKRDNDDVYTLPFTPINVPEYPTIGYPTRSIDRNVNISFEKLLLERGLG